MVTVISLGGSIVAPESVDESFLKDFTALITEMLNSDDKKRFIIVVGGGGPARVWQKAYKNISANIVNEQADWIGIMATRLNAQLVKAVMDDWCTQDVVYDPTQVEPFMGRVMIAAGWKPGFSSDYDAVLLAERFQADAVINLSNIDRVYTDDPNKNPDAKPIDKISWKDFCLMVGEEWVPGKNVPFDPIASKHASKIGLKVICAAGRNLPNLKSILLGGAYTGTTIGGTE